MSKAALKWLGRALPLVETFVDILTKVREYIKPDEWEEVAREDMEADSDYDVDGHTPLKGDRVVLRRRRSPH